MTARDLVLNRFSWIDGHADVWALFRDADVLRSVVDALVEPYADERITVVCGIEARGFVLGGAAAVRLGAGFAPIRTPGGLLPGETITRTTSPDYRQRNTALRLQHNSISPGDRVLLVDDWAETASQLRSARDMITSCAAHLVGCSVIIDQLTDNTRTDIGRVHALVQAADLPHDSSHGHDGDQHPTRH